MGVELDHEHREVIDLAAINLNIKRKVISDRGPLSAIISLGIDWLGEFLGCKPESVTKIRGKTSIKENEPACSGIT